MTWKHFNALVRFSIEAYPRNVWFLAALMITYSLFIMGINMWFVYGSPDGEYPSVMNVVNEWPLVLGGQFGLVYFMYGGTPSAFPKSPIPNGEFLLVRPFDRRMVYLAPIAIYFLVMISAPLLKITVSIFNPDIHLFLSLSDRSVNEAAEHLSLYQAAFPDSLVVHKSYHDILVIPFGLLLVGLWDFFLAILFALVMQIVSILVVPSKIKLAIFMLVAVTPALLIMSNITGKYSMDMECIFFFFAGHWILMMSAASILFTLVQLVALRHVQKLEAI